MRGAYARTWADPVRQRLPGRKLQRGDDLGWRLVAAGSGCHAIDGDDPVVGANPGDEQGRGDVLHVKPRNFGIREAEIDELVAELLPGGVLKAERSLVRSSADASRDALAVDEKLAAGQISHTAPVCLGEATAAGGDQHDSGDGGGRHALKPWVSFAHASTEAL